jgi:hypothetical protein
VVVGRVEKVKYCGKFGQLRPFRKLLPVLKRYMASNGEAGK